MTHSHISPGFTASAGPILSPRSESREDIHDSPTCLTPEPTDADIIIDLPKWRRWVVLFTVCWTAFPATYTNTSILAVAPEVAAELHTTSDAITIANAGVFLAMAVSPFVWMPIGTLLGRRKAIMLDGAMVCLCSTVCALAPRFELFVCFWLLAGLSTPFLVVTGQSTLAEVFEPTSRAFAQGFISATTMGSNAISPLLGAVIAEYTNWRLIYGISASMSFLGLLLCFLFMPPEIQQPSKQPLDEETTQPRTGLLDVLLAFDPRSVLRPLKTPAVALTHLTNGLLGFSLYGLLASVRRIINPRFNLTTPLTSGMFYLGPGAGLLIGCTVGGRMSDHVVKVYIRKRDGVRVPEDRLRTLLPVTLAILPASTLLYGWSVQCEVGGMPLPAAGAALMAFGLTMSYSSLNTFAAEVLPREKVAVISSKYLVQYCFGAASVGAVIPMVDGIGVGWALTCMAGASFMGGILVLSVIYFKFRLS